MQLCTDCLSVWSRSTDSHARTAWLPSSVETQTERPTVDARTSVLRAPTGARMRSIVVLVHLSTEELSSASRGEVLLCGLRKCALLAVVQGHSWALWRIRLFLCIGAVHGGSGSVSLYRRGALLAGLGPSVSLYRSRVSTIGSGSVGSGLVGAGSVAAVASVAVGSVAVPWVWDRCVRILAGSG